MKKLDKVSQASPDSIRSLRRAKLLNSILVVEVQVERIAQPHSLDRSPPLAVRISNLVGSSRDLMLRPSANQNCLDINSRLDSLKRTFNPFLSLSHKLSL